MATLAVETGIRVPGGDSGVALASNLIRPAGPGRSPVVLMRTPYDRSSYVSVGLQVHALRLAESGYAVVLQDVRGRFASTGEFLPFTSEQADGLATIEWIADRPWSNGRVAMAGISYSAFAQLSVAVAAPEPLAAWVPALGPFDVRTSWIREGGALNYGFHLAWGLGTVLGTGDALEALARPMATARRGVGGQRELGSTSWFERWTALDDPYPDDRRVPGSAEAARIRAPALVVGGWYDLFQPGTLELYAELSRKGASPHGLVMGPWDHAGLPLSRRSGDVDFGAAAAIDLHGLQLSWYDHHLRDDPPPPSVRIFLTGADRWMHLDRWPPETEEMIWYPHPAGALEQDPGSGEVVIDLDDEDPTPPSGGRLFPWEPILRPGAFDQRARRRRPDVADFTSDPLESPLVVMGPVRLEATVTAPNGGTDLVAVLVDVAPDGTAVNVADGVARRAITGGDAATVRASLGQVAHEFRAGHRLGLDISVAAFPRYDLAFGSGVRILQAGTATRLVLPVVAS